MKKRIYFFPISIEVLEEGGFLATCPIIQGCRAEGKTYAEVIENIQDVVKVHIEARKAHGEIVPEVTVPQKTEMRFTLPLPVSF
jgi:predicted RNase H-like HicB family nuclease